MIVVIVVLLSILEYTYILKVEKRGYSYNS
jgi:hypothetical protein